MEKEKINFYVDEDDIDLKSVVFEYDEPKEVKDVSVVNDIIGNDYIEKLMSSEYIEKLKSKEIVSYEELSLKGLSIKQKTLIRALINNKGLITQACKDSDVAINSYYRWLKDSPHFATVINLIQEIKMDFVEEKFLKLIEGMNVQAILFAMKTLLKSRGYSEDAKVNQTNVDIKFVFGSQKLIG